MARLVSIVILTVLGAAVISGCAPSYASERSTILADADLNNSTSQGAPQQAVAAEWAVRDMAALIAKQNTEQAYLMYGVLVLLALSFLTSLVIAGRLNRTNNELADLRNATATPSAHEPPFVPPGVG